MDDEMVKGRGDQNEESGGSSDRFDDRADDADRVQ
jgi:hypothetical protein